MDVDLDAKRVIVAGDCLDDAVVRHAIDEAGGTVLAAAGCRSPARRARAPLGSLNGRNTHR